MGEEVFGKSAPPGRRCDQEHDPHGELSGEDQQVVAEREEGQEECIGHQVARAPGEEGGREGLYPEAGFVAADFDGAADDVASGSDGSRSPAAQDGQREEFGEEPFQPDRVEEQSVAQQEEVGEFESVADRGEEHQFVSQGSGEEPVAADDEKDDREDDGKVEFVEKRGEHDDGCAPPDGNPFFVDEDHRHAGAADGRRCDGRGEFPQHDDPKGLFPGELSAAEEAYPDHVAEVAPHHEEKGEEDEKQGVGGEADVAEDGGVEVPCDHPGHEAESEQDRQGDLPPPDASDRGLFHGVCGSRVYCEAGSPGKGSVICRKTVYICRVGRGGGGGARQCLFYY